jgi:methionyl-tRNA formyltransferase
MAGGNGRRATSGKSSDRVLLVCMRGVWTDIARTFVETMFENVEPIFWDRGDPYPSRVDAWQGEWILSFRGDLILSPAVLSRASKGALNFHPAPPEYRGIGSHAYAIFNGDTEFGSTCHHINEQVDAGEIIRVDRFPIPAGETASSLALRAGAYCLTLFYEVVVNYVLTGRDLPTSSDAWGPKLYTYKDLSAWQEWVSAQHPEHLSLR